MFLEAVVLVLGCALVWSWWEVADPSLCLWRQRMIDLALDLLAGAARVFK